MQAASDAWVTAASAAHVEPVLLVELLQCGVYVATRTVRHLPVWKAGQGLTAGTQHLAGATRGPYATTLAPFEQAVSGLGHALDERGAAARLGSVRVELLNQHQLCNTLAGAAAVDNTPLQVSLTFPTLGPDHALCLFRGVVDDVEWDMDRLILSGLDDTFRVHRTLSQPVARSFPGAPREQRGRAIPILIGRQTDWACVQVGGAARGQLACALGSGDTELSLTPVDATFPDTGTLAIGGGAETGVTYAARAVVTRDGISYLQLSGLVRGAPAAHVAGASVVLTPVTYRYLVGYEVAEVSAVRDDDVLVTPGSYTVTLALNTADHPVTVIDFGSQRGTITVDADGLNVSSGAALSNGGFETGDASGWTLTGGSVAVTTGDTDPATTSTYKAELTGSDGADETLLQTFVTTPGTPYTLLVAYQTPDYDDPSGLLNADPQFSGGLGDWTDTQESATGGVGATEAATGALPLGNLQFRTYDTAASGLPPLYQTWAKPVAAPASFVHAIWQDVTTLIGETYTIGVSWYAETSRSGPFDQYTTLSFAAGSAGNPSALLDETRERPAMKGWRSDGVTFVATQTTTRVTVRGHSVALHRGLASLPVVIIRAVSVRHTAAPVVSSARVDLGTDANPSAYVLDVLPHAPLWRTRDYAFTPETASTRLSLKAQWAGAAWPVYFDSVRLAPRGRNPADAIAYVIDTYVPELVRDAPSFADARTRRAAWQFGGALPDPGDSKAVLERLADQCACTLVPQSDGTYHLVAYDTARATVASFTTATIVEGSLRVRRETLDNVYTEVYIYFGLRNGASPTSPASYQGETYATPEATTHPTDALDLLCGAARATYRVSRRLDVFADMIRDLDTANLFLVHKVAIHTVRHDELTLRTHLAAAPVQVADMVKVTHPWLHSGQPQICQVRGRAVRGVEVELQLRTVKQAGFYEPWEAPTPGAALARVVEPWGPATGDVVDVPGGVGAGLVLWVSADDPALGLADTNPVSTWTSRVGAMAFTQATSASKPQWRTNILGGKPAIRFDGTDDRLSTPTSALNTLTAWTIIALGIPRSVTGTRVWLGRVAAGSAFADLWYELRSNVSAATVLSARWTTSTATHNLNPATTMSVGSAHRVAFLLSASGAGELYVNGTSAATLSGGAFNPSGKNAAAITLGASRATGSNHAQVDLCEVIIYNRVLTPGELADVDAWLVDNYSL